MDLLSTLFSFAVIIGAVLLMLPLGILFHECGHALAGRLAGMRLLLFVAGPLRIKRERDRFRISLAALRHPLGLVVGVPADGRRLEARLFLFILGGPVTNLLLGALFPALALVFWRRDGVNGTDFGYPETEPPMSAIGWALIVIGLGNLLLGTINLVPQLDRHMPNDGHLLFGLLLGRRTARRHAIASLLAGTMVAGMRPRDLDPALLARMLEGDDSTSLDAFARLFGYFHSLDSGQVQRAGELLDEALRRQKLAVEQVRAALLLEGAFFEAFHRRDPERGRKWLEQGQGGVIEEPTRLRAEAAVLIAEGRPAEAAPLIRSALSALDRAADIGGGIAEREWLEAMMATCNKSRPITVPE